MSMCRACWACCCCATVCAAVAHLSSCRRPSCPASCAHKALCRSRHGEPQQLHARPGGRRAALRSPCPRGVSIFRASPYSAGRCHTSACLLARTPPPQEDTLANRPRLMLMLICPPPLPLALAPPTHTHTATWPDPHQQAGMQPYGTTAGASPAATAGLPAAPRPGPGSSGSCSSSRAAAVPAPYSSPSAARRPLLTPDEDGALREGGGRSGGGGGLGFGGLPPPAPPLPSVPSVSGRPPAAAKHVSFVAQR